jgi:xanthine dehydrogenase accessory factor
MNPYQTIEQMLRSHRAVLMVTKMGPLTSGGTEALSREIYTEALLQDTLRQKLADGRPQFIHGDEQVVIEPFFQRERLIIFGGGHIAVPLCHMAAMAGFGVTVVDDRPSFANTARFPSAEKVICNAFSKAFAALKIGPNDFLVIITRGHQYDALCLKEILSREETIYTGMIGSRRRVATVFEGLKKEGFDSARIQRICAPIGLAIGAVTPGEISVSILSELIQRKRKDPVNAFLVNRSDMESDMIPFLATVETPSALVTVIETTGSAPRGAGAKMLVGEIGILRGSIGGGCAESEIMHAARAIIGTGQWKIADVHLTEEDAEREGMVCGGTMKLLIEDFNGRTGGGSDGK